MSIFFYHMFYVFGISFIYTFSVFLFRVLYIFLYLSCVHLSRLSYVFSIFLFFFRLHIMSLIYVFFICRCYDLLNSMYYSYTSHIFIRSYSIIYFVLLYSLCAFPCVGLKPILSYYISIFVLHEFYLIVHISHRSIILILLLSYHILSSCTLLLVLVTVYTFIA